MRSVLGVLEEDEDEDEGVLESIAAYIRWYTREVSSGRRKGANGL